MTISTPCRLAFHGGKQAVHDSHEELFKWPIVTPEDEKAVLDILRKGSM